MRPEQVTEVMNDPLSRVAALHDPGAVGLQPNGRAPVRDPHRVPLEGWAHRLVHLQRLQGEGACRQPQGGAVPRHRGSPYRALLARGMASLEIVDGVPPEYLEAVRKSPGERPEGASDRQNPREFPSIHNKC